MGKKRRLNSAKIKFKAKHNNHPRARLLAKKAQESEEQNFIDEELVRETPPKIELQVKAAPPEPTTKKVDPPKPEIKKATQPRKKKAAPSGKRTTRSTKRAPKKKTTSASV